MRYDNFTFDRGQDSKKPARMREKSTSLRRCPKKIKFHQRSTEKANSPQWDVAGDERRNACSVHREHRNGTVRCKCCTMLIATTTTAVIAISINHHHRLRHTIVRQHTSNRDIVIIIGGRPRFFLRKRLPWRSIFLPPHSIVNKHAYTLCILRGIYMCVRVCHNWFG